MYHFSIQQAPSLVFVVVFTHCPVAVRHVVVYLLHLLPCPHAVYAFDLFVRLLHLRWTFVHIHARAFTFTHAATHALPTDYHSTACDSGLCHYRAVVTAIITCHLFYLVHQLLPARFVAHTVCVLPLFFTLLRTPRVTTVCLFVYCPHIVRTHLLHCAGCSCVCIHLRTF